MRLTGKPEQIVEQESLSRFGRYPMVKYSATFAILSAGVAVFSCCIDLPLRVPLIWLSLAWMVVATAYLTGTPQLLGKQGRRLRGPWYVLCLPHLALSAAVWHLARLGSSSPSIQSIRHDLFIGRRLLAGELPVEIASVVDLTAEFSEPDWPRLPVLAYPILDGVAPTPSQLLDLAKRISELPGPVFIHCALGYGRTATVVAAVLMHREQLSLDESLRQIASVRLGSRPNRAQRRALERMVLAFHAVSKPEREQSQTGTGH